MSALSLCLVLLAAPTNVRDGTVIVVENGNPAVKMYTKSEITHVALILHQDDGPWVYEAAPREVRKLTLADYYRELGEINRRRRATNQMRVLLYQPSAAYSSSQVASLRCYLDSQIGRRYSVKGYLRDKPGDGVHCAELVGTALTRTGKHEIDCAFGVNPSSLVSRIVPSHDPPLDVALPSDPPPGSWCQRSWHRWADFFVWCGWACGETWSWVEIPH